MDVIFCGTPQFAVPTLQALVNAAGFRVRLVVTQPDRPSGRGMEIAVPPVKQLAQKLGIEVTQPDKIKNNLEFRAQLEQIKPEAIVVVGYGRIIPQWMIDLPPLGNINLHGSLLPKYRGAAPVQWAIAMGETVTGITTMQIDAGLDTGDILLQRELPIPPEDTAETLAPRLAEIGAKLMVETLPGLKAGTITPRKQDNSQASLAPILKKEDGLIDFRRRAREIWNRLRGFQPWPGAYTTFRGRILHVWEARPVGESGVGSQESAHEPGELRVDKDRLFVACGERTALELLIVQPEGKKRMPARDFVHGYHPKTGEHLGSVDKLTTDSQG
ncbi:MAG: methionyl-tRNA formyltransferase [Acidobacteriia bacterium]|nr:methionyl-tRNA formyltransferase [Terriglobia bacterium]